MRIRQDLIEREAHVRSPLDCFPLLRGRLQPADHPQWITSPQHLVTTDVLNVKTGHAMGRPVLAQVAVAPP